MSIFFGKIGVVGGLLFWMLKFCLFWRNGLMNCLWWKIFFGFWVGRNGFGWFLVLFWLIGMRNVCWNVMKCCMKLGWWMRCVVMDVWLV